MAPLSLGRVLSWHKARSNLSKKPVRIQVSEWWAVGSSQW
ncbi:hypothetical protein PSPHG_CDS_0066 [Pseudomonas phage Psxphi15]